MSDPRSLFPNFHNNPAIQVLGRAARWTISGQLDALDPDQMDDQHEQVKRRKAPIDLRHLLTGCNIGCQHTGPARGAWATDERCLVTLDELTQSIPDAANNAFYLNSVTDGLMIIDIEPSCPPAIAAQLLALPREEILYEELSMSGRGFHLVTPLPHNFFEHQIAARKTVLRHEQGWYEILLQHWATFTRRPIPSDHPVRLTPTGDSTGPSCVAELYESLAALALENAAGSSGDVRTDAQMPEIRGSQQIIATVLELAEPGMRSLEDFGGDNSRWEFSVLGRLYGRMRSVLRQQTGFHGHDYSAGEQAWLLYTASLEVITPRAKHNERRNNRPFLLDRAASLVAAREAQEHQGQADRGYRGQTF